MSAGTFARNRVLAPPIVPNTQEIISFPEILCGALGPREAEAAAQWIDQGSIVDPLATGPEWVPIDSPPHCFDTRVWDQSSDEEDAGEAINVPQAATRSQPRAPRPRQPKQPQLPAENAYGRAAFVSHSDAVGTMARRRARSSRATTEVAVEDVGKAPAPLAPLTGMNKTPLPPNPQFPGWKGYELQLPGPRDRVVPLGTVFISPTGVVCKSFKAKEKIHKAETTLIRPEELEKAIEWIRYHGVASKATIPKLMDAPSARWMVMLERRKHALKPRPQKKRRMSTKGDAAKGGGSSKAGGAGPSNKKQKTAKVKND